MQQRRRLDSRSSRPRVAGLVLLSLVSGFVALKSGAATLITNANIVDGTGAPARMGSVRIDADRIVAVGDVQATANDVVVDAGGLVLAPGFIDTHSHVVASSGQDENSLQRNPDALAAVTQGITTVIVGADGGSSLPLAAMFSEVERAKPAINVATYVGHGTIRMRVMGQDYKRAASAREIEVMRGFVARAMEEGALGLSSGLEYDPGIYSSREEVMALAEESARHGGRYASHIRSEDRDLWEAIDEVIEIGRRTHRPVHISHMKIGMKSLWGQDRRFLQKLDAARKAGVDISGDVYPYDFWHTTLIAMFPNRDLDSVASARASLNDIAAAEGIVLTDYPPDPALVGKTLAQIATERKQDAALVLTQLVLALDKSGADDSATMAGMSQRDVDALMQWRHTNICTDGSLGGAHPRGAGTFPRIFRYYVREKHLLTLEEAVRKATSQSARNAGLRGRGVIEKGAIADLVLFDADRITDHATPAEPRLLSTGVSRVWVSGGMVYADGKATGTRTGRIIRRQ